MAGGTFRNNIVWGNTGVCELVKKGGSVDHCCYPEAEEGEFVAAVRLCVSRVTLGPLPQLPRCRGM